MERESGYRPDQEDSSHEGDPNIGKWSEESGERVVSKEELDEMRALSETESNRARARFMKAIEILDESTTDAAEESLGPDESLKKAGDILSEGKGEEK